MSLVLPPVVNVDPRERRVLLKDLNTVSVYEAFVMVNTFGGSLNGSTIHFKIEPFGWCHSLPETRVEQRHSVYSRFIFFIKFNNMNSSHFRRGYCRDDCDCDRCWTVTVDHFYSHDLFLQQQKVRSLCHSMKLWRHNVLPSPSMHVFYFDSLNSRLKGRLWPVVPDPANSSITSWTSESSQVGN